MAQLTIDIGGRPGIDCRGFCEYCYFRRVKEARAFGCRHCPPFRVGCGYCTKSVQERYPGFKGLREIADDTLASLQLIRGEISRVTISGGGDPSCYPRFRELIELTASMEAPLHIGYTSGKGFDDPDTARFLLDQGLEEISFTVFSVSPALRRRYMHDPTPEASLQILGDLCGEADVYAAAVVLPGVNDGEELVTTAEWLQDRGARGLILMRFANTQDQGLILGNAPIIKGQRVHSVDEFRELVTSLQSRFRMKISGTPLWDPEIGSPFAILQEAGLLERLPRIQKKATVVTGSVAAPLLRQVLDRCGGERCTVIPVQKEIACLITGEDLARLDPAALGSTVVIPGRSFVHDREAEKILTADGVEREVVRGPDTLTADAETSMGMTRNQVLEMELEQIAELIRLINRHGE
ncbi:MAG: methyl coenzyme M reductase-arginine methyltransferase Mmp10 [Methanomicrobiales archaeon]|nr:methyl coenzyme M reductase-arginine methyltransferase Mmp10 [Methanomicrobiales archaeon]